VSAGDAAPTGAPRRFSVTVLPGPIRFEADSHDPVLLAARRAGIRLPSSCRNGTCRACICRLLSGEIAYQIEWPGLSADEKREGHMLPCVAQARSDLVMQLPE
jgi:ferredoxin